MALVKGTKTSTIVLSCAPTGTIAHSHDVGANGLLVVLIAWGNNVNLTGVTYGGVAMTRMIDYYSGTGTYVTPFYLAAPATGSNNVVVTMSTTAAVGFLAQSYTGAVSSITNVAWTSGEATSPTSQNITVSANSMLIAWSQSTFSFDSAAAITIDGVATGFGSCDLNGTVYTSQVCVHANNTNLSAGSKTVITDTQADIWICSNGILEIKEVTVASVIPQIMTNLYRIRAA